MNDSINNAGLAQAREDIEYSLRRFPLSGVLTLYAALVGGRMVRGEWSAGQGTDLRGCFFFWLSEGKINRRELLTEHFTDGHGPNYRERAPYQPARYLCRLYDGSWCPETERRYRGLRAISLRFVEEVVRDYLLWDLPGSIQSQSGMQEVLESEIRAAKERLSRFSLITRVEKIPGDEEVKV